MIIVDNAVEYVLKAYVEIELNGVGSGTGKVIKRTDWEEKKQSFDKLLEFVLSIKKCNVDEKKILEYHRVRNSLYHTGLPLSVKGSKIDAYVQQCKLLLSDLIGFSLSETGWKSRINLIDTEMKKQQGKISKPLIRYDCSGSLPKFLTDGSIKDTDAVMLAIDCFTSTEGKEPTLEQLESILTMSRHRLDQKTISKNMAHLRKRKLIDKKRYYLQSEGTDAIKKNFFIDG
ncbi:MAG: hypothetical protein ACYC6W_03160 [Nitrosotalea sp.]